MTATLRPSDDQDDQSGDQAVADYQRWRSRMTRRTGHPSLPPSVPPQRKDSSNPA